MQENRETEVKKGTGLGTLRGVVDFFRELIFGRENANERLVRVIAGIAFGIVAYFFGKCEMLFETFPLGVALLCAADRHLPYIFTGLALSAGATGLNNVVCIVCYTVVLAVRIMVKLAHTHTHSPTHRYKCWKICTLHSLRLKERTAGLVNKNR